MAAKINWHRYGTKSRHCVLTRDGTVCSQLSRLLAAATSDTCFFFFFPHRSHVSFTLFFFCTMSSKSLTLCHLNLSKADGKRPDGLTMVPWREGKPLTWDVTVVCPLAESYIGDSATNAGSAAEAAATRKAAKYAGLERTHIFQSVAVENLGTMNASAYGFLAGLGQKISAISGDDRETCYLFQRISVLIQRFNATLLH